MSKFYQNQIKDGWEKLHKQTNRQTNRHYENNGHLAVNQKLSHKFRVQTSWNVNIARTLKGHISVLLEATLTWSGMLVGLYVLCMLIWCWPDPRWRSLSFWNSENCTFLCLSPPPLACSSKLMVDYDSVGPSLQFSEPDFWISPQLAVTWLQSSRNVDINKIHWVLSPRCLRLEACDFECR